jgi:sigma-B regulation protein RsbU (phosphoserine phosphatase)
MARVSGILGVPVRLSPDVQVQTSGRGITIGDSEISEDAARPDSARRGSAGEPRAIGPPRPGGLSLPGGSVVSCLTWRNPGWFVPTIPVTSSAGFGEEIADLIVTARDNPLATVVLIVLGFLSVLLIGAIVVATMMVTDMARSIAGAVRALTTSTAALREGKLEHRIPIEGKDELWDVAASFNRMAEGLERMRGLERESQRLEEELRLAREIQDRLLPARPPAVPGMDLAGLSLPAREIGGDYFDYLALEGGRVAIALADVSGKGVPAALLMSSFRASLRSQDLAALGPAEALSRINRFLHASVEPGKFITAFLAVIDPPTGSIRYVNAGHEPPVLLALGESIQELGQGGLILGVVPDAVYEESEARLEKGSLLAVFSDGVTEARRGDGEFYGPERLLTLLRSADGESAKGLADRLVREVRAFAGDAPQYDDITLVLAKRL